MVFNHRPRFPSLHKMLRLPAEHLIFRYTAMAHYNTDSVVYNNNRFRRKMQELAIYVNILNIVHVYSSFPASLNFISFQVLVLILDLIYNRVVSGEIILERRAIHAFL